jgi:hypothetical protein
MKFSQYLLLSVWMFACSCSWAETYPVFMAMPKAALVSQGEVIEVSNMPEARSQGRLPVCYGITAWYAYMQIDGKCM